MGFLEAGVEYLKEDVAKKAGIKEVVSSVEEGANPADVTKI